MHRVLILHALLGTGHLTAARALEEGFSRLPGVTTAVEDSLDFINPALSTLWKAGYKELSERASEIYNRVYQSSDSSNVQQAALENLRGAEIGRVFFRRLERYVTELQPDAVIAVMAVPLLLMGQLKTEGKLACPLYAVITDYVAHSIWVVPGVKRYFLPSDLTAGILTWQGLDPSLLQVTGIPINPEIAMPKEQAAMRALHGLPVEKPLVTIFGGGVAPATIRMIVARLLGTGRELTVVAAAGRNEKLLDALADLAGDAQTTLVKLGPIDYVDDLVAASDLVISKPGGLITSEVLGRGTPMIAIEPLPGQEEPNADFVSATGSGVALRMADLAPAVALQLLDDPDQLAHMRVSARNVGRPRAALTIAEQVLADIEERAAARPAEQLAPYADEVGG